jgi:hypothetical protein
MARKIGTKIKHSGTNHDYRRNKNLGCGTNQNYMGNKNLF